MKCIEKREVSTSLTVFFVQKLIFNAFFKDKPCKFNEQVKIKQCKNVFL